MSKQKAKIKVLYSSSNKFDQAADKAGDELGKHLDQWSAKELLFWWVKWRRSAGHRRLSQLLVDLVGECAPKKVCPWCKAALVIKVGQKGPFWACSDWPNDRYAKKIEPTD